MTIKITTAKGDFTGSIKAAAKWLAEMQPSFPSVEIDGSSEPIEVEGTPDAEAYEAAILAAVAADAGSLRATRLDGVQCVADTEGGVWTPDSDLEREIAASLSPAAYAVAACHLTPSRGKWQA